MQMLCDIGREFARLRDEGGRSEAFAKLQTKLMANLGLLVPTFASLEQCVNTALKIEDFRKSEAAIGKSPSELFSEWLRDDD